MKQSKVYQMALAAMIAAMYAAVSLALAPISFGTVQLRIAEALTLLPVFDPVMIVGVSLGCLITNTVGGYPGMAGHPLRHIGNRHCGGSVLLAQECAGEGNSSALRPAPGAAQRGDCRRRADLFDCGQLSVEDFRRSGPQRGGWRADCLRRPGTTAGLDAGKNRRDQKAVSLPRDP